MNTAISISVDGGAPVCVACAERMAIACGFQHLFWASNVARYCNASDICPQCGKTMGEKEVNEAVERVTVLLTKGGG